MSACVAADQDLGAVALHEPDHVSRADRERRDLSSEVADRLVRNADVALEERQEQLVRLSGRNDAARRDAKALLVDLSRVRAVARGRPTTDVEVMAERAHDGDRRVADDDGREGLDVRQMLSARVRVVRRVDVARAPAL